MLDGMYQGAAESTYPCLCCFGMNGVSSVPCAMDFQSAYSPWERDQNKVELHAILNSRTTVGEDA